MSKIKKKHELLQDAQFCERYAIVMDGKLYEALPWGAGKVLTALVNEHMGNRPLSEDLVKSYYKSLGKKIPASSFETDMEVLADALRYATTEMLEEMSKEAIDLRQKYQKAEKCVKTAKRVLAEDRMNRAEMEVQR